jgi:Transposase DDE domain
MSCSQLYHWTDRVTSRFPTLSRCQARLLALYSFGLVLAHSCGLSAVALALAKLLGQAANTLRQRLRDWYLEADAKAGADRTEIDPAACFGPLLDWVLATWDCPRLALALDATYLGDRFIVLAVAVVYRGCAVPVAWVVRDAHQQGSWLPCWRGLLAQLATRVPRGWTVTVLSDRGLESADLFATVTGLGWHPLMRVKGAGQFRPDGWHGFWPMPRLVPRVGGRWKGRGHAYKSLKRPLRCTLLACWEAGHEEPWLVLTDLAPRDADAAWYGWRCWVEQSFKVAKRGGWQWQRTRMDSAERAARLWAVLALATLWLVEVGGSADLAVPPETVPALGRPAVPPEALPAGGRLHSAFRAGLYTILAALWRGEPLPRGRFVPQEWPAVSEVHEMLTEQQLLGNEKTYP